MKTLGLLAITNASSFAATVAQMSGTEFYQGQFGQRPPSGIPVSAAVVIIAGMIGLFAFLRRQRVEAGS
jgi:hypothetical protein